MHVMHSRRAIPYALGALARVHSLFPRDSTWTQRDEARQPLYVIRSRRAISYALGVLYLTL